MGFKDWFNRGKQAAAENKDAVKDGIDKTGEFIDEKTGGKHAEHIDQAEEAAKDVVDDLGED